MEYLHLFKTKTEHDSFYGGNKYKEPWLAYTRDNTLVTSNRTYEYYRNEYLTIEVLDDGDGNITITIPAMIDSNYATSLSYSKDKSNWTSTIVDSTEQTITIPVSAGEDVYLKGEAWRWCDPAEEEGMNITSSANMNASGNIMSLLYGDNFKDKETFPEGSSGALGCLFNSNEHLIDVENLILPATTLAPSCYIYMFQNCTSLTTAPELPATTLADYCYNYMFSGCASLVVTPTLPVMELKEGCYVGMFSGCTSLTTAPELPVTELKRYCYNYMFQNCSSLTTAPELPATTLAPLTP